MKVSTLWLLYKILYVFPFEIICAERLYYLRTSCPESKGVLQNILHKRWRWVQES